jgi:NTP pyrophosphatase (non-canonical NTP hydrolase)
MNFDEYQQAALRTVNPTLDARDRLLDASAGLAEEAGEVLGLVRKRTFQQREITDTQLLEELGDVLWCLAVTADSLGITLSAVADHNQAKLIARHPEGWSRSPKE